MSEAHKNPVKLITPAEIDWHDKTAVSRHYDDIYFSAEDGIAETEYVFLTQNKLPQAWQGKEQFCILETGFGTGLNFFCTLDKWFQTAETGATLTYISVEKYPLSKHDFKQQQYIWPQFSQYIQELVKLYPPMISGFHSLSLCNGRIKLLLLFGDATEQLSTLVAKVDACYLDGFAPSKNKSMWHADLYQQLARLLKPGATLSTFTAVGEVRRGLQQAGFEMKKLDAYGSKRHMLSGQLKHLADESLLYPWFQYPDFNFKNKQAVIIGAGIAGLTTALALSESGWQVTIIERSGSVASGASGNPAGVVMPRLDKQQSSDARFYWQAFYSARRKLMQFKEQGLDTGWQPSGVMQLNSDTDHYLAHWPEALMTAVKQEQSKKNCGVTTSKDALWLPQCGYINPKKLCTSVFENYKNKIRFVFDTSVSKLTADKTRWQIHTNKGDYYSDAVVICNAEAANQFSQSEWLNLQPVRGQVSYLQNTTLASRIKSVICDSGYAIPLASDQLLIGATFERDDTNRALKNNDHLLNLKQFYQSLDEKYQLTASDVVPVTGRASIRAMTPDRLPLVGAVADYSAYQQLYADLARGKRPASYQPAAYHQGLFINAGHGSRGLTSCFLSADILSALMSAAALPVDAEIVSRLHPARFIIKGFQKGSKN